MKEENKNLLRCIAKTTLDYWKRTSLVALLIVLLIASAWITIIAIETAIEVFAQPIYNIVVSISPVVYALSAIIIVPIVVATIVCYHKRVEKENEQFTCPE